MTKPSERDAAATEYIKKSIRSNEEIGYGTPDEMYCEWAFDAFCKGWSARDAEVKRLREALKAIICNGPMSYEEHSERADKIASEALKGGGE